MLTEKTPPQPRFRIWDVVRHHKSRTTEPLTVVGIQWEPCASKYRIELILDSTGDKAWWIEDHFDLVSRPGLQPQPVTPVPPQEQCNPRNSNHWSAAQSETLQQKVARLKEEFEQCDDKGWLGKMVEWERAEKDIKREPASPSANTIGSVSGPTGTFDPATVTLDLLGMHRRLREVEDHLLAIDQRISPLQRVKPVVIGTACASDNKDG